MKPEYTIKLTPELWEKIDKLSKKQIAELLARLKLVEGEMDETRKEIKKLKGEIKPEEVKLLEEALIKKRKIESGREQRRFRWLPERRTLAKSYDGKFFRGRFGSYKYLDALEEEESESGIGSTVNIILRRDENGVLKKKIKRLRIPTSFSMNEILSRPYVVSNLKTGIFVVPLYSDLTPVYVR